MNSLNTLRNVLYKLKKEEVKSLLNFLKYHQKQVKDQSMKSIQLVELILSDKNTSSNDLQHILYGELNYVAFNKLINRLKDKIYEVMLFDANLSMPLYSERNREVFELRKKLIQSEILFSRGIIDNIEYLQNKIIAKAKDYEIYDSLVEALHAKQRYLSFKSGVSAHKKIEKEILFFSLSRDLAAKARNRFNSIMTKINFSTDSFDYKDELNEALDELKEDYEKTGSATIGYYFYFLETEKYMNEKRYLESTASLKKVVEVLQNNRSVFTNNRMGSAIINLAVNQNYLFNFDRALEYVDDSKKYFAPKSSSFEVACEIEFDSLFYSGKLSEAGQLIEALYHLSRTSNNPFLYARRAYLFACVNTLKGSFQKSNQLLSEVNEIEKDKEGWNIGKRILTIINRIEIEDFESVDLQVQNLEKHIKRTLKIKHVRKRNILILRILLKLINEQFNFKKVYKNRQRYFHLLESNDHDYRWQIKSPELIIFHEWFRSKMEKRPYDHSAAIEKEKERWLETANT
jgi:hypothetical protein